MSSLKMTFSLTSLILIFGLAFVGVPVIADDGGTAIPAGGTAAQHNVDGHADQTAADAAENAGADHMHPKIMISATDADSTTMGTQVIPTAETGTTASDLLSVEFPVKFTLPASSYNAGGTTAPSDTTLSDAATSASAAAFIGNAGGGAATITGFTLKSGTMYEIDAVVTVTLVDPAASPTDATAKTRRDSVLGKDADMPLEVTVMVANNVIVSADGRGPYRGQTNVAAEMTFTIVSEVEEKEEDPDPVMFEVSGTPSLTAPFTATFTSTSTDADGMAMGAMFVIDDVKVTGGYAVEASLNSNSSPADAADTVWTVIIQPYPGTKMVSVTVKEDTKTAPAAAVDDMDMASMISITAAEATLNSIVADEDADDSAAFIVSFTFAAVLPDNVSLTANDIKVTPATVKVGTPVASPADAKIWQVLITPTTGMDTKIELTDAGKLKFAYSGSAVTVMKKGAAPITSGMIAATLNATKTESTLSGAIAANGFVVVSSKDLPDLEEFFDIGGTIGLHDADAADGNDKNSREVVMSEILWGLDFGATAIADQKQWQFIELYNTTSASIDLTGWMLKFTEGRPVPKSDVDQVSNRAGTGWIVDIGQSGRVTGTTAADAKNLITPINVVSMYRNIDYTKVEKVKADGTADPSREEQLKGIPGGNGKGSWKASVRRDPATPAGAGITGAQAARWVYSSRGREHYTTTAILTASAVARSPFIINEIGNGSDDTEDWVELRNVTSDEASLKNYHLSYTTKKDEDVSLVNFHDKDIKVPGNGVILLVNTDPQDTDIAAGRNAAVAEADQVKTGATSLYYVNSSLKLPDDGKFNLILRNAHDKLKASSHFMDIVAVVKIVDDTKGTSLWPLVATGAPHGNVIDGADEAFKSGLVYQRGDAAGGFGEKDLAKRGYTGIGYDRAASKSDANGGTPGYDNGALKEKVADLSDAEITISEIMVDTGDLRTGLPQWIELYNSSMTQAVNLNGWKLMIENAEDPEVSTLNATLTLDAMTISPNQTVLITSTSGRNSDPDHFPSTRVVNLWVTKKHREALEMTRRTSRILSVNGFHLMLKDKDNKTVDMAGNLDGNRRTRDEPTWMIPMSKEEGRRSSLIRVYDDKIAVDGEISDGWVLASDSQLAHAISHTFYGNADDYGTPGFRAGGPLPVSLSKFRPERLKDTGEVVVRWVTESELNNAGFNILRSEKRDGEFTKVHYIAGQGTTSERTVYEWKDKSAKPNVVYYYQIQDVSLDGDVTTLRVTHLRGNVTAAGKLTTTWAGLKALQ